VTPVITQADRSSWQRLAAAELARILDRHPELPCITWTVGPASSVVIGRVTGLAPAGQVRQVFRAWQQALGLLGECHEQPGTGSGGTAWLHAADRSGEVTVRLAATVLSDAEEGGQ
jgi:hypothetical protein